MSSNEVIDEKPEKGLSREAILLEVGELLKNERNKKSISIDMVANALNFRKIYLEALESGDWSHMPGEVYALGFLRQYATYLHLDLDHTIEKLKSGHYQLTKPLTFPDPPVAPKKSWMMVAALAFVLLFVGINLFDHTPAPLPSQLMQASAVHTQAAAKLNTTNTEVGKTPIKEPAVEPVVVSPLTSDNHSKLQSKEKIEKSAKVEIPATKKVLSYHYKLTAVTGDVWLQLHDSNEPPALIREVLLKKGESMKVTYSQALRLTSGNALALKIDLNNHPIVQVSQLGEKGKVLRSYLLQKKKPLP
ncbi:MAG: hypothetical protein COB41_07425 [Proteobacteria bacterium]|nr:MAG: hypothetical protein COB41_07425 [Pseudomonadota bacterium]